MSGTRLIQGFLVLLVIFTAALIWFQFFAYYQRDRESDVLRVAGRDYAVSGLDLISAETSPLKLRACFVTAPGTFDDLPLAEAPTPLTPPIWYRCFDPKAIGDDIASGAATAHLLSADDPAGFDIIVATYPDGRSYVWRQLGAEFTD